MVLTSQVRAELENGYIRNPPGSLSRVTVTHHVTIFKQRNSHRLTGYKVKCSSFLFT